MNTDRFSVHYVLSSCAFPIKQSDCFHYILAMSFFEDLKLKIYIFYVTFSND